MSKHLAGRFLAASLVVGLASGVPAAAQQVDCGFELHQQGFVARGRARCGFPRPAQEMSEVALGCLRRMPEADAQRELRNGAASFDRQEPERGHDLICDDLRQWFPGAWSP